MTNPVFVFAHGAGAGSSHPWMVRMAKGLEARGLTVVTFDFPYIAAGKRLPDKREVLESCFREVVARFPEPVAIGGKSMGGRIASQIASSVDVTCLVFFGYPLHPPGKPEQRRDAHLPGIKAPMLFIQGANDPFGGEDEIVPLAKKLHAETHIVAHGDHSLTVPKRGFDQAAVDAGVLDAAASFIRTRSRRPRPSRRTERPR